MKRLSLSLAILLSCLLAFSQQEQAKYEQEDRIKAQQVPAPAIAFIADFGFAERLKWYREDSQDGHSFEAKVKANGIRYSIEFDSVGHLQDVELKVKWKDIPPIAQSAIQQELDQTFSSYRILKIQRQWSGSEPTMQSLIRQQPTDEAYTTKYEIVLRGKADGETHWYEMLYNAAGKPERKSRFVPRNTDNLDY